MAPDGGRPTADAISNAHPRPRDPWIVRTRREGRVHPVGERRLRPRHAGREVASWPGARGPVADVLLRAFGARVAGCDARGSQATGLPGADPAESRSSRT